MSGEWQRVLRRVSLITLLEHSVDPTLNNSLCTLGQRGYERRTRIVEFERKKLCERVFVPCFHLSRSFRNESINPSYAKPSHLYSIHLTVHVHTSTIGAHLDSYLNNSCTSVTLRKSARIWKTKSLSSPPPHRQTLGRHGNG